MTFVCLPYVVILLVYADVHGNLKIMFNEPVTRKFVHALNSKVELVEMVAKIDHVDPSDMYSYDES